MNNFLLLIRIGVGSLTKASDIVPKILPIIGSDIAKPIDLGDHCAILFKSAKEATSLVQSISDHIYGDNSFVITVLGGDWASCNIESKPEAWLRQNIHTKDSLATPRSIRRG